MGLESYDFLPIKMMFISPILISTMKDSSSCETSFNNNQLNHFCGVYLPSDIKEKWR